MLKRVVRLALRAIGVEITRTKDGLLLAAMRRPGGDSEKCLFAPKFSAADIEQSLSQVRRRWEHRNIVVLTDQDIDEPACIYALLRCGHDAVTRIGEFDPTSTVFLYACDSDDIGLPYVQEIVRHRGIFFPVQIYTPSAYSNINSLAKKIVQSEIGRQSEEGFDKFDFGPGDSLNIIQAIAVTAHLPGDYVEIGCFRGSSACIALSYMRETTSTRNCYFLDVFEGFTYQVARASADVMWAETHATEGIAVIAERISTRSNPSTGLNAFVIKNNVIDDPLPNRIRSVALANIDVDLYEAVLAGLNKIAPKMVPGGIIVVEDPGHTPALIGSRLALHEFLESSAAAPFTAIYLESGQTFLVKVGST